jgi:hypothetical protein
MGKNKHLLAELTKPILVLHRILALQISYSYYCYVMFVNSYAVNASTDFSRKCYGYNLKVSINRHVYNR